MSSQTVEHIIALKEEQNERIVLLAKRAGYDNETTFIQDMIEQLADFKGLGELLAKELNEAETGG